MTPDLFTPLDLGGVEAANRVMVSPMCQYSCDGDGLATEWHRVHLGSRATGGAGVVMTEATAVEARGRISPEDLGIWSDAHAEALAPVAEFLRDQGAVPAIQLAHAGRKGSKSRPWEGSEYLAPEDGGYETIAPSAIPYPAENEPALRGMDHDDIETVVDAFAAAATRAVDAGFEVVEVHAAHGYLLHQFLSPVANHREDEYGGDFDGRTRIVRETTRAVEAAVPDDVSVFVRVSATDWLPERESWTVDDTVALADDLAADGADLIDVSAGGLHPDQEVPSFGPGYQVPYAERVREGTAADLLVGAVGGITEPEQADQLIRNGRSDLAIVGREHLRDPYFTLHAAQELGMEDRVEWPVQYRRAVGN